MEAVIAGWMAGFAMAIATTLALTFLAWRAENAGLLQRFIDRDVPVMLVSVPISTGATVVWTMAGLLAGSAYRLAGLDDETWPPSGFYVVLVGIAALPLPPLVLLWPRYWWLWLGMSGLFVLLFGGLMPPLAAR
ncbi:MAG TPA: hypothetical protein VLA89_16540 [Gemmatimonadales bacterium]|nr:hypothetical protein [Gemmatimonadales bacterium]